MTAKNKDTIEKTRLSSIDKACGISILLVVFGHIYFKETIETPWYIKSHTFIYKFHMPLFMCISGYLAFLSTKARKIVSKTSYLAFQKQKLHKFLPVYVIASLAAILVDYFYKNLSGPELSKLLFNFFFVPASGSAVFIWYIYVLIGFYLATPFLINLQRSLQYLLLLFGFLLTNGSFSPLFSADLFAKYFFFFFSGGLIYLNKEEFDVFLSKYGKMISFFTFIILILDIYLGFILPFQLLSVGVIISTLYISRLDWPAFLSKLFITLGISSFAIYILNGPLLNVYYIFYKVVLKKPVDSVFIFSSLIIAVILSVVIRTLFNKVVPKKVYSL